MQDEINEKTIALYIKTGKLTAQTLQKAMKTLKCGVLNIHHGNRVPIVVCGRESRLHGKGEQ